MQKTAQIFKNNAILTKKRKKILKKMYVCEKNRGGLVINNC